MTDIVETLESQSIDLMAFSDPALLDSMAGRLQASMLMGRAEKVYQQAAATIDAFTAERDALLAALAEAVDALEPFARIGGYVTEECGWTPDDEIELMFGDRGHVLATTEARHFIRAREVHRKAKGRNPVEKQNSGEIKT